MKFIPGLALSLAMALAASVAGAASPPAPHGPTGLFGGKAAAEGDMVDLSPGDVVVLRLTPGTGGTLSQAVVAKGAEAGAHKLEEGEVKLTFTGGDMTMLEVVSRYPRRLHYKARIGSRFTSVCPLFPGVMVYESWQQPIARISVGMFREVGDDFTTCM